MKRLIRFFIIIGATLLLFAAFILIFNKILERQLDNLYSDNLASINGATEKIQGVAIQERGIDANHIMLFGSSELSSYVPQNPVRFFPTKDTPLYIDAVGRGHSQCLEHMLDIGALGSKLKGKKIAIVVSLQWFVDKEGIPPDYFAMNFSEQQFYEYLGNKDISKEQKKFAAERVYESLKDNNKFKAVVLYAKLYLSKNALTNIGYYFFKPYNFFRENLLYSRALMQSIKYIKENKVNVNSKLQPKEIDWQAETKKAEDMGKKAITNNIYNVEDSYYLKYLKPYMDTVKNRDNGIRLKESKEFKDLDELLKTIKSVGADPYIIIMPVNGLFYDYLGPTKEERFSYYDAVEAVAQKHKVASLKMTEKEYEPYFMTDIMHLGWKGWLYVDEKIAEFISKN